MNILESAIKLLAPHNCIVCRDTDYVLCQPCSLSSLTSLPSRCYRCHRATKQSRTCRNCRRTTGINRVWVATSYETAAKELIYKLKFERAKSASCDIADIMDSSLPILPDGVVVTHLPTANSRIRVRGYDQARLIAKDLSKSRKLAYRNLLSRQGQARQTGSSRQNRFKQLEGVFTARDKSKISGMHILLVDDIVTTGASIESATKTLYENGAKTVDVAVFAQP